MNLARIGSHGVLNFSVDEEVPHTDSKSNYLTTTVELEGLRATKSVYFIDGCSGLLSFFEGLVDNWRGWDGERNFESIEGDFRLAARHDGRILLAFELAEIFRTANWAVRGEIALHPGEELTAAHKSLRDVLVTLRS